MKRAFLFSIIAIAAVAVALPGCRKPIPEFPFDWEYTVKNDTDREIVVSYNLVDYGYSYYGGEPVTETVSVTIAPGDSRTVIEYTSYGQYNN
jgi:hypothetical protein